MSVLQHALILAAGRGSRLGEMTEALPKGLVELGGRPLLHWQIDALRQAGLTELGIVRGYRAEALNLPQVHNFENPRWAQTQMVQSLACAEEWLTRYPCLLSYADILTSSACLKSLAASEGELVISSNLGWRSIWQARFADPLSDVESFKTNGQGQLLEIGAKASHLAEIEGQYMGLLKITPLAWSWITALLTKLEPEQADRLDMTSLLQALLKQGYPVQVMAVNEPWLEIDTPEDLALYRQSLQDGKLSLPMSGPVLW
ncbi:MAG: phosphocholine cytidylyltransferase family protein [Candidatus Sericytochromatia bacterium]